MIFANTKTFYYSCNQVMGVKKKLQTLGLILKCYSENICSWLLTRVQASVWGYFLPGMYSFGQILTWNALLFEEVFTGSSKLLKLIHFTDKETEVYQGS